MIIARPRLLAAPAPWRGRRLGAAACGPRRQLHAGGSSTSTWRTPSARRSRRQHDAREARRRPGGRPRSPWPPAGPAGRRRRRPRWCSTSPTCTSALPAMKRSSSALPAPAPPKAALRSWVRRVQHRDRGVLVGQQRDLGRQRVDARHLAEHAGLVDHRRAERDAVASTPRSMMTLREYGSAASYSTSAACERTVQRRAQLEQRAQARVLLRQLLDARGALGLPRQLARGPRPRRRARSAGRAGSRRRPAPASTGTSSARCTG